MSLVKDERAPIVYLRSFSDDDEDDPKRWDEKTSEELIATALKDVGPVLAVKDQRQEHKILGATRIVMGENWRDEIKKLILISRLVIVEANYSQNLLWELEAVKKLVPPERLIISFLSRYEYFGNDTAEKLNFIVLGSARKSHYEIFDNSFAEIFGVRPPLYDTTEICFFYFDKDWNVCPVPLGLARSAFAWLNLIIYNPFYSPSNYASLSTPKTYKYHLPFWKIKRALMLILHNNGIIAVKKYVNEIDAERRKLEKNLKNPVSRIRSGAEKKLSNGLRLAEIDFKGPSDELENALGSDPLRSLLDNIDSFRPHKKTMIRVGAAIAVVAAGFGVVLFLS